MKSILKPLMTIFIIFPFFSNTIQAIPIDSLEGMQIVDYQYLNPKSRFEVGLEIGLFSTKVEYLLSYKELPRNLQTHSGSEAHHSVMNGLSFTHRIADNWWLQTGFRYGRSNWSKDIFFESFYDKSQEQLQPDGEVLYDLTLLSSGNIGDVEINFNTSVNNTFSLDEGEAVASIFSIEKRLDWLQIPLGVVYRLGKQNLNYEIKSGLSLNQITTGNYNYDGLIESSNSRLLINETVYPEKDSKRFLGIYLGGGLRYYLSENIILQGNFNFRYEPAIQVYVNDVFTSLHFGASYLF